MGSGYGGGEDAEPLLHPEVRIRQDQGVRKWMGEGGRRAEGGGSEIGNHWTRSASASHYEALPAIRRGVGGGSL